MGQVRSGMGVVEGWSWLVAMLGLGGDVGFGGREPRIVGIEQCIKRYCTAVQY